MRLLIVLLLFCISASGQTISYFNQGFLRQPSADLDRNYLGVPSTLYTSNLVWVTSNALVTLPLSPLYVKKAGDTMSGLLKVEAAGGIVVSNDPVNPTALNTTHGLRLIGANDNTYIANDDVSGINIFCVGAGAYPGGPVAINIDLNGTITAPGGLVGNASTATDWLGLVVSNYYHGAFSGNGSGLTNIPIASITTPGAIHTNGMTSAATFGTNVTITPNSTTANLLARFGSSATLIVSNGWVGIGKLPTQGLDVSGNIFGNGQIRSTGQSPQFWLVDETPSQDDYIVGADLGNFFIYNNTRARTDFQITSNGVVSTPGTFMATNGIVQMVKPSFTTNFTCTTNLQTYLCNGTNQVVTLPNAANVPNVIYRFASTNGWGSFILTNATGAQTIRDGVSLSHKQIGITPLNVMSDGSAWWFTSKDQIVNPNAQFSTTTNITLTAANTAYPVTFNSIDFNNSQGIALGAGTNGLASKMWITNSGQYMFSPSIVMSFGGNNYVRYWFRSNGTNIPNSCTPVRGQNNTVRVVTVPFLVSVTQPTAFEIWAESDSTTESLLAQAASGNYPAAPSVICPVMRISDIWP